MVDGRRWIRSARTCCALQNRLDICRRAMTPLTLVAADPSLGAPAGSAEPSSPPFPASRESTSLKSSCEALKASSRVPALDPMPALSFFRNCFTASVLPLPSLPSPWPCDQPIPKSSFIPILFFSSSQNDWPWRPALPYMSRNFFASPLPMVLLVRRTRDGWRVDNKLVPKRKVRCGFCSNVGVLRM